MLPLYSLATNLSSRAESRTKWCGYFLSEVYEVVSIIFYLLHCVTMPLLTLINLIEWYMQCLKSAIPTSSITHLDDVIVKIRGFQRTISVSLLWSRYKVSLKICCSLNIVLVKVFKLFLNGRMVYPEKARLK